MKVTVCDRPACGELVRPEDSSPPNPTVATRSTHQRDGKVGKLRPRDLCSACAETLKAWWENP